MTSITNRISLMDENTVRRWGPGILVGLAFLLLLPGNNLIPLIDRDEPRFAEATREMVERNDWIIPYFNGDYRFDKPILIYWMMRGAYAVFGVNEFAARLPSVVCGVALVWLTFQMGTRWFSATVGFAAAFALLTCVQMLIHGRSAVADMPMVVCVLVGHLSLFEMLSLNPSERFRKWWVLFWVSCGVGFLAKGPVAIVLPILTLLFYRFAFLRQPLQWRRLRLEFGLPLMLLIIGSWGLPALVRTNGEFFRVGIGKHVIQRGFTSFEGHGAFAPYYYLLTAFLSLFPWIAFAGNTINVARSNWNLKNAFLLSWVSGTYLLFTCYLTKLPHYVLPAFPALFLMFGQGIQTVGNPWNRFSKIWFWMSIGFGVLVSVAVLLTIWLVPVAVVSALIILSLTLLPIFSRQARFRWLPLALLVLVVCTVILGTKLRAVSPTIAIRDATKELPSSARCVSWRYAEPSLVFYTARHWESANKIDELKTILAQPGPCLAVCQVNQRPLANLTWYAEERRPMKSNETELESLQSLGLNTIDINGPNIARGSWVHLRVYYRR